MNQQLLFTFFPHNNPVSVQTTDVTNLLGPALFVGQAPADFLDLESFVTGRCFGLSFPLIEPSSWKERPLLGGGLITLYQQMKVNKNLFFRPACC